MHGWMLDPKTVEERREEMRREVEAYRLAGRGGARRSRLLAALSRELRLDLIRLARSLGVSGRKKRKGAW
ncbi:MAG: hypothetical protein AB1425_14210 [Actinomycetota bacterium]